MTAPTSPPPMSTRTRIMVVAVLAVAISLFVIAGMRADTDGDDTIAQSGSQAGFGTAVPDDDDDLPDGVERFIPAGDTEVLAQEQFGIDLEASWLAELTFFPANGPAIPLAADDLDITPELALFLYQPGPGDDRPVERLPGGENCVEAVIWDQITGREASERTERWCFSVV